MNLEMVEIKSPIGDLTAVVGPAGVCALGFSGRRAEIKKGLERRFGGRVRLEKRRRSGNVARRVARYFAGDLKALNAVSIDTGGTRFQRKVWAALRKVPAGRTISYGGLAKAAGAPAAGRAVGAAMARNPVAIIIPCHRVIGSNGRLTGYGGGMKRKEWLLEHEGAPVGRT